MRIRAEGLYQHNHTAYFFEIVQYLLLFSAPWGWYGTSVLFHDLFWHQLVISMAHDAGHMGMTHSFTIDTMIGIPIATFWEALAWADRSGYIIWLRARRSMIRTFSTCLSLPFHTSSSNPSEVHSTTES